MINVALIKLKGSTGLILINLALIKLKGSTGLILINVALIKLNFLNETETFAGKSPLNLFCLSKNE